MVEIKSPKSDIAKKQILAIEKANIIIKEKIVEAFKMGVPKEQLSKELLEIIEEIGEELKEYPEVYALYMRGMKASTQRWFRIYQENMKTITNVTVTKLAKAGIPVQDIDITYSPIDKFRPFISNNPKGLPIIEDYQKKVKQTLATLIHDNPTSIIRDNRGTPKKVSLRNQAETIVRIEANEKDINNMKEEGVKLVVTTSHADCSSRCEPWQGRIYSLDGTSGYIDGKRYIPIEKAMRGEKGDGNGIISGYNCRHRAIPYKRGMAMPTEYTSEQIKKEREIDSKQRYQERTIRTLKVQEHLLRKKGFKKEASQTRLSWRKKQAEYKVYSLKNGRSFEEWRCRISDDEKEEIIQNTGMIVVQSGGRNKVSTDKDENDRATKYADAFYERARKDNTDILKIAKNTKYSINMIQTIKNYVFYEKHDLDNGYMNFDSDFEIANAWKRLMVGNNIRKSDIILLKHEYLEHFYVKKYNMSIRDAHNKTCEKFDYQSEIKGV